ncbi:MAG: OmpP1/FadL family transporter [Opitutales bacterium]
MKHSRLFALPRIEYGILPLFLIPLYLEAEGFRNPAPGAYGLGQTGGRNAYIDDASAALHNPANLVELETDGSIDSLFSPTVVHIVSEFEVSGGSRGQTKEPLKLLPSLFLTAPGPNERLAFGLSVTVPYGLATKWEQNGPFGPGGELRYLSPYDSEMLTMQFNPVVAYRINDQLTAAVGLSALYSELSFKQFFPQVLPLVENETIAEIEMDGWGIGANFAISWDVTERDRIVLTLRSQTTIHHQGDSRIGALSPIAEALGFTSRGSAETSVTYPWIASLSYGRKLSEALIIEVQYERVGFSNFEELNLDLANNTALFDGANVTRQDWKDSQTFGISLRYDHGKGLRTHASAQLFQSPVPDDTLSTTIPDGDQIALSIGLTKRWDRAYAGIAYSYVDYESRSAEIGGVEGTIQTRLHLLALNAGWRF